MNKIALYITDGLLGFGRYANKFFHTVGIGILVIGKFTILPIILFIYKITLRLKIKTKKINILHLNYVIFIKKYLPALVIIIIIISVSTNNIFAQNYSTEEYANRTLLSSLITSDEESWSELVEESGPAINQPQVSNYLEDQGSLQEIVINTPFVDSETSETDVSPDSATLVLVNPEDTDTLAESGEGKRDDAIEYIVQSGDVLGHIAEKFNVTVNTILWENKLSWNSTIRPGQKLTILPNSGVNHEIKSGDTILAIAKKYQTESSEIVAANKLADAGDIQIGDLLFIPGGVKPTQVVSSYRPPVPVYSDEKYEDAPIDTSTKLLWPSDSHTITQYYHWRHHGVDIADNTGTPIYAAEAGKIERSGWSSGYGYNVVINHGNGIKTLYGHASKLLVNKGDSVSRGQTIALVGSTGWSTGPHIHFEVRVNESRQNPLNYIK